MSNLERSSKGLSDLMFDELVKLREGTTTPQQSRAFASIANTICTISRLEMDYTRLMTEESKNNKSGLTPLPMGTGSSE